MAAGAVTTPPSAFSVFRNRSFTLLWTAQLISSIGAALTALAASILVYRLTGSALSVGLMMMATAAPTLAVGLLAGVLADRWDRKRMMVVCELVRALLIALIPVLLPYGIGWLYLLVMLSSTVAQFFNPAHASVLPEVASEDELAAANSMMTISSFSADVIGFAGAGFIAAQLSIAWAFYLDALSFLVSALCIARLSIAPHTPDETTTVAAVFTNLRAGMRFVRDTPALQSLFVLFPGVFCLIGFGNALNLPFALRVLGLSEFDYGLIEGIALTGFIAGSLAMATWADRLHDGQWLALSLLGMGILSLCYAASTSLWMALVCNLLLYVANAPSFIVRKLILQRHTPRQMLGRINSAFVVTRDGMFLIGMGAAGLADLFDVRLLLLVAALLLVCLGLVALRMPGLRQSRAEWRRALSMLRRAASAPGLNQGRAALPADVDRLVGHVPVLAGVSPHQRRELAEAARVYQVPAGTAIVRHGDRAARRYQRHGVFSARRTGRCRPRGSRCVSLAGSVACRRSLRRNRRYDGTSAHGGCDCRPTRNAAGSPGRDTAPAAELSARPSMAAVADDRPHAADGHDRSAARGAWRSHIGAAVTHA